MDRAETAYKLQQDAQKVAEKAIRQLEEFIGEDSQVDHVSAENTMQLLRERSRTITNLSLKRRDSLASINQTDDAKVNYFFQSNFILVFETFFLKLQESLENQTTELAKSDPATTEKIQVILDNASMRFPSKSIVEKLIEYINFESTNKFTLIINNQSRPNTSHSSPLHHKSSIKIQEEITTFQTTVERKSARSYSQLSITADLNNNTTDQSNANDEIIDQVINKVDLNVSVYTFH